MKVFIDYELNETGKSKFLQRLIPALAEIGVECSFKNKKYDVALGITKWRSEIKTPKVLRIDGIAIEGKKMKWKNEQIRKSMKRAKAIVYQSNFARRYIEKHLNINKKSYVIYNGVNPDDYKRERSVLPYEVNYLMSARWGNRKHKRLKDHIRYAEEHPDIHFWLAGETDREVSENVSKLGWIDDKKLKYFLSMCSHFVYLADIDWCPNGVVEARVAGLPVIYNPECEAVEELCNLDVKEFYINSVAKKYKKVFENVL